MLSPAAGPKLPTPPALSFVVEGGGRIGALLRTGAVPEPVMRWLGSLPESLNCVLTMMLEAPSPMCIGWGPELSLIYNDSYADAILGARHPAALGAPVEQVWGERWPEIETILPRILEGGTAISGNVKVAVETAGRLDFRWLTFSLSPLRDDEGRIGGFAGVGVDTTAAVLSEDRLLYERNRIRDFFQQSPAFMATTAGADHVVEFANDAFYALVGDRQLVGRPVRDAFPEAERQGFFELQDRAFRTGQPAVVRDSPVLLDRDGTGRLERRNIDVVYQPIKQGDLVVGTLIEGYDVTEQKKAKEEIMLLQSELIHASRLGAMSAMAATLAHELNQPLTAIKAYVVGARRRLDDAGAEAIDEVRIALAEASDATTRAGEIIRRIRAMVRRGEPEVEIADLGTAVREAVSLAALGLAEEGVLVREDIAEDVPVRIDKVQIQQVVVNLFRNAHEAALESKRREIRVSVRKSRGSALLQVDDSGPGIDTADSRDIFSPLFTTKAGGLGVGLAISRTIVEAHSGVLLAGTSELGGARFSVKLPLASETAPK